MSKKLCALVSLLVLLTAVSAGYAKQCTKMCEDIEERAGWIGEKLVRGSINLATGLLEIPAKIDKNVKEIGGPKGLINGFAEGLIWGAYRTAAGLEDLVTSPLGVAVEDEDVLIDPPTLFESSE